MSTFVPDVRRLADNSFKLNGGFVVIKLDVISIDNGQAGLIPDNTTDDRQD